MEKYSYLTVYVPINSIADLKERFYWWLYYTLGISNDDVFNQLLELSQEVFRIPEPFVPPEGLYLKKNGKLYVANPYIFGSFPSAQRKLYNYVDAIFTLPFSPEDRKNIATNIYGYENSCYMYEAGVEKAIKNIWATGTDTAMGRWLLSWLSRFPKGSIVRLDYGELTDLEYFDILDDVIKTQLVVRHEKRNNVA